jgi:nucleotide-binding universal stress UspA family protein
MKILIAIEDEIFGEAIAHFVAAHAWPANSEMRLIHVMEPIHVNLLSGYPSELIHSVNEERQRAARSLLLKVGTEIAKKISGVQLKELVLEGHPKDIILDQASEWPADLIVLGSHGRSGMGQFLLGSVSLSIMSAAPCSLMVVKLPKAVAAVVPEQSGAELVKN